MSYGKWIELYCDGPGESGRGCGWSAADGQSTVVGARKRAREQGWTHRGGLDYCPECSKLNKVKPEASNG